MVLSIVGDAELKVALDIVAPLIADVLKNGHDINASVTRVSCTVCRSKN